VRRDNVVFRVAGDPNVQRAFANLNVRIPLKFLALVPDEKATPVRRRGSSTTTI